MTSSSIAGSIPVNDKLERLRACFADEAFFKLPISAFIIPHDDQHMSEYLAETDKRLEYVCGFTGSAGTVVITMDKAMLWTDGRYFIQASEELKPPFELKKIEGPTSVTPAEWLASNLTSGDRVSGDPALFSCEEWQKIKNELESNSMEMIECNSNIVDHIWLDKPGRPSNKVTILEDSYSGRRTGDKILDVVAVMKKKKCDVHVVSELDNVAWLLNLRGTDIPYNPVFFSFVIIQIVQEEVTVYLFIDQAKLSSDVVSHIVDERINLKIRDYSEVFNELSNMMTSHQNDAFSWLASTFLALPVMTTAEPYWKKRLPKGPTIVWFQPPAPDVIMTYIACMLKTGCFGYSRGCQKSVSIALHSAAAVMKVVRYPQTRSLVGSRIGAGDKKQLLQMKANADTTKRIWISNSSNYKLLSLVPKNKVFQDPSIVTKLKAIKNAVEAKGMINAHIKDGYALCSFLQWLEENMLKGTHITEISAATKLQDFRSKEEGFRGLSFATISSVGEHAAIIHYQPSSSTDAVLALNKIYLVDSGGQYLDGTTDVTRTVHFGSPTEFEKECFTRVLKGVISLNSAIFPANLKGNVLDSFARRALWDVGLQYGHGTGHGIGAHLCVHEGPIGVSWRPLPNDPGLDENMFISNEPGYYKENHFGVRIENIDHIIRVVPKYETPHKFLTLKTVTLCPIQTKLINPNLLSNEELQWLNNYHQEVRETLVPIAEKKGNTILKNWLIKETEELKKS